MPFDAALDIANLTVNVAGSPFVQDITLSVPKGEIHGLIGPNGAGKTTILRCLYRAATPSTGTIRAFGKRLEQHSHADWARQVGAVVQGSGLLTGLTPRDIVEIGLALLGLTAAEVAPRVDEALHLVGLADRQHQPASALSGGELQRCYFAQLLACDPEIYVLDEPTNHLDLHYQLVLLDEVRRRGRSVLMTLHDLPMTMRYCDRVYLMNAGRIAEAGTATEVLTRENLMRYYLVDGRFLGDALSLVGPLQGRGEDPRP